MANGTILVTGGAKRIGAEICKAFAQNNWRVLIHFNTSEANALLLKSYIEQNGGRAELIQFDLSDTTKIDGIIKELCNQYKDLCAIINNASIFEYDDANMVDVKIFNQSITINCLSPILISQAFAKYSNIDLDRRIINILDQKLKNLNPDFFSYTISKFALDGAMKMLAMEMQTAGIRINNIAPGITMLSGDQTNDEFAATSTMNLLNKPNSARAIADAAIMLVNCNITSGTTIHVDCGQNMIPQERDVMFLVRK